MYGMGGSRKRASLQRPFLNMGCILSAVWHRGLMRPHIGARCRRTARRQQYWGCGADICYPAKNQAVYEKIKACGCILSEYPPGTAPAPWHFPRRNRIISGMADAVIVVRSAKEKRIAYYCRYGGSIREKMYLLCRAEDATH